MIVPFEKEHGDLLGLSNEPFLSKPIRHPEHDKNNPQLKNSPLAALLHNVLEVAHAFSQEEVFGMLIHVLRIGRVRAASRPMIDANVETNYRHLVTFCRSYLTETDGGARLVAVAGAFLTLLNRE